MNVLISPHRNSLSEFSFLTHSPEQLDPMKGAGERLESPP